MWMPQVLVKIRLKALAKAEFANNKESIAAANKSIHPSCCDCKNSRNGFRLIPFAIDLKFSVFRRSWERNHVADIGHTGDKQYQTLKT